MDIDKIYRIEKLVTCGEDNQGREIERLIPDDGEGDVFYQISIQLNTPQGAVKVGPTILAGAMTAQEAFDNHDEAAHQMVQKAVAELQKQRIIVPSGPGTPPGAGGIQL